MNGHIDIDAFGAEQRSDRRSIPNRLRLVYRFRLLRRRRHRVYRGGSGDVTSRWHERRVESAELVTNSRAGQAFDMTEPAATAIEKQIRCARCNRRLADLVNELERGQVLIELKCSRCGHPHLEIVRSNRERIAS